MTFSEMIAAYGDDNLTYQKLDECFKAAKWKKGVSEITFVSDQPFGFEGTEKVGLILWFDREKLAEVIEEFKEKDSG